MKKGKFETKGAARKVSKKLIALALALVLTIGGVVGGTLAWLTSTTGDVVNTFTPSDINIALTEEAGGNEKKFKMVPGDTFTKDPKVTVDAGSEACWLFVAITETNNLDTYIAYDVDGEWFELPGYENIYYREVSAETAKAGAAYYVLGEGTYTYDNETPDDTTDDVTVSWTDNQVAVKPQVTKEQMNVLTADNNPTLTFDAAAIQSAHISNVSDAWSNLPSAFKAKAVASTTATP